MTEFQVYQTITIELDYDKYQMDRDEAETFYGELGDLLEIKKQNVPITYKGSEIPGNALIIQDSAGDLARRVGSDKWDWITLDKTWVGSGPTVPFTMPNDDRVYTVVV